MAMVFLLSHPRSGSHFLKDALHCHNSHCEKRGLKLPHCRVLPEVLLDVEHRNHAEWTFGPYLRRLVRESPDLSGNPKGIARAVHEFFDHLEQKAKEETVLVDVKLNQLYIAEGWFHTPASCPRLLHHLARKGKFIFLRRRNVVRAMISELLAKDCGVWHVIGADSRTPERPRLKLHCKRFLYDVRQLDQGLSLAERWLGEWKWRVLRVDYEDLFEPEDYTCKAAAFDRIAEFAGLAVGANWQSTTQKLGTYTVESVVENYWELRKTLAPTPYAAMLDDDPPAEGEKAVGSWAWRKGAALARGFMPGKKVA